MARSQAHTFVSIENPFSGACYGTYRDEQGAMQRLYVVEMSDVDMLRALKMAAPGLNGKAVNAAGRPLVDHLRPVLLGEKPIPDAWYQEPESKPAPAPSGDDGSELAILRRILGSAVDEDKVRAIVADAVKDIKPKVVRVEIKDRPTVEIKGRSHKLLPKVIKIAERGLPVFLSGEPGTGKSTLAEQVAEGFGIPFYGISCNVQMSKGDLLGYRDATREYATTEFRMAYEDGGVFLFDEMDKSNPNILATLNQAVANGWCSFPDARVKRHGDFRLLAAGNTWGTGATADFVGSMKLDAATMNRYVKLHCERDPELERDLVASILTDSVKCGAWVACVETVRRNIAADGLKVFCTMRDAINGAHLVDAGWSHKQAISDTVTAGLDVGQARKVLAGV